MRNETLAEDGLTPTLGCTVENARQGDMQEIPKMKQKLETAIFKFIVDVLQRQIIKIIGRWFGTTVFL